MNKLNNVTTIAIKSMITLLLLWLILVAGKMGYANLHFWSAKNHLSRWSEQDYVDSDLSYKQALAIN